MTRHYFTFRMIDGSAVTLATTVLSDAEKVINGNWTTNASTYFTPWMKSVVIDTDGHVIEGVALMRVNLPHVASIEHWEDDQ